MGCYNQYKARGCSYTECKSQHASTSLLPFKLTAFQLVVYMIIRCLRDFAVGQLCLWKHKVLIHRREFLGWIMLPEFCSQPNNMVVLYACGNLSKVLYLLSLCTQ